MPEVLQWFLRASTRVSTLPTRTLSILLCSTPLLSSPSWASCSFLKHSIAVLCLWAFGQAQRTSDFSVESCFAPLPLLPNVTCAASLLSLPCNPIVQCANETVVFCLTLTMLETQIIPPSSFRIYHSNWSLLIHKLKKNHFHKHYCPLKVCKPMTHTLILITLWERDSHYTTL